MKNWTDVALLVSAFTLFGALTIGNAQEASRESTPKIDGDNIMIKLYEQQLTDAGRGMSQVFLVTEEDEIFHAGNAYKIVKPAEVSNEPLAYTRIYFIGRTGKIEKGVIVLIADFESSAPQFFIDQNNNLDFTDDGVTQVTECKTGGVVLEFRGDEKGSKFAINLIPFRGDEGMTAAKREQFLKMFQGFKNYMGGEFADVECWYFNRRLNNRTASVEVDGQKLMIGLHDYDCDGLYSGARDRLLVGEYQGDSISDALADGAVNVIDDAIFMIGDKPYRIVETTADGSSVTIAKSDKMPERLFVGNTLPKLQLTSFEGTAVDVNSLVQPGKWLVLDFWGQWCGPCIASIPSTIEFYEKWEEKVVMVGVHMGDHELAKKIIEDKKIPFRQFESSDEAEEVLFIDAWPTYVVIDDSGKLVSFRSSLKEIVTMLEKADQ